MPVSASSDAETPPLPRPERRVLARAVGVWWVQRLLEAARRRRASVPARDRAERPEAAPLAR